MKDCTRQKDPNAAKTIEKQFQYYCGIDIHKKKSYFYIIDNKGKRVFSGNINTNIDDYRELLERYEPDEIQIAIEIGSLTFSYCDLFLEMGISFYIVNTAKHYAIAKSSSKTDKKDAKRLAINLWKDVLPQKVYMPTPEERQLRTLISHRAYYVKQLNRLINVTMAFLATYHIVLTRKALRSHNTWMELDEKIKASDNRILKHLFSHAYQDFLFSCQCMDETEELLLELVGERKEFIEKYDLLLSIPGVGTITAIMVICMAGNIDRFQNVRQFVKYLGLAPKVRDSGGKQYGSRKITKEGNGLLRGYLGQCTLGMMRTRKLEALPLQKWHNTVKKRRGWKKARVAATRKLVHIIFGVLKHETPYNPAMVTLKRLA